jgi:hypothetical protein
MTAHQTELINANQTHYVQINNITVKYYKLAMTTFITPWLLNSPIQTISARNAY